MLLVSLAKLSSQQRREVASYLAHVEMTASDSIHSDFYKLGLAEYLASKGEKATRTDKQRNELFKFLEDSCLSVRDNLHQFADKKSECGPECDLVAEISKWSRASWVCEKFLSRFSQRGQSSEETSGTSDGEADKKDVNQTKSPTRHEKRSKFSFFKSR